jgi:signal transduction histidine kinase
LQVDLLVEGSLRPLPTDVDLAGYRIVQETLTNVLKHGSDHTASLKISRTPAALTITVVNQAAQRGHPSGEPDRPGGLGLVGIRERVSGLRGNLSHTMHADGVFELTASLPLVPEPA